MDKIKNTKEKFYLFKKHFRNELIEDLIKYTNKSLIKLYKKKKEEEKKEETIEKQNDNLFLISSSINQPKPNFTNLISQNKYSENKKIENNSLKDINELKNNLIFNNNKVIPIKKNEENSNNKYNYVYENNKNFLITNDNSNKKNNNNKVEIKKNNENNNLMPYDSDSSSSIVFEGGIKKNEEKDELEIDDKDSLKDNNSDIIDGNIFDKNYMLDFSSEHSSNSNNNSPINLDKNNETVNSNQHYFDNNLSVNSNQINKTSLNNGNKEKKYNKNEKKTISKEEKKMNKKTNINNNQQKINIINNNKNNDNNNKRIKTSYSPVSEINIDNENAILNLPINNNKFQIPLDLEEIDTSSKKEKVKESLNINNNNEEQKGINQNLKKSPIINSKKGFSKKENKNEQILTNNKKIIIDDEEDINQKKALKEKKKIEEIKKEKPKLKDNPYVFLNGTQIKLKLEDNQFLSLNDNKSQSTENNNNKKEVSLEKNIKPLIKKSDFNKNLNFNEHKLLNVKNKIIDNNNINHKKINNDNKSKFVEKEKEKLNFPKKESSACLLSQLNSILKEIKENLNKDDEKKRNVNISKVLEGLLKDITDMEKLEQIKRRKHVCKQVPKLISILFKNLEELKKYDFILKNIISMLECVKVFFHQMKLNYIKLEGKVPIKFSQLRIVIKYIYSLFKIKSYNTKILKEYIKKEDKRIFEFAKCYKTYQNCTDKLYHFLKKNIEEKHKKKYKSLDLILEMDPCQIYYSICFKQGRKLIDFIFEYFERERSSIDDKKK